MNLSKVISASLFVCLISCSSLSQRSYMNDQLMTVSCTSSEGGTILTFMLQGTSVLEEEIMDSRGCIIDSIFEKESIQYFICHEYDSFCSLYRYFYKDGQVIKQEVTEITEALLQIDDPSQYSVDYRKEKLFELQMKEPNKVIVRTNILPDFNIPHISREIIVIID